MMGILERRWVGLYHVVDGAKVKGKTTDMRGDCSGLSGDCTEFWGNCTGLSGDLDMITQEMREKDNFIGSYVE